MSEPDPAREKSPTPTPGGLQTWPVWISVAKFFLTSGLNDWLFNIYNTSKAKEPKYRSTLCKKKKKYFYKIQTRVMVLMVVPGNSITWECATNANSQATP